MTAAAEIWLWRIATDTPDYEAHDTTGRGAETSGGRWNRPGTPMLYTSESRALAWLETVVHLAGDSLPLNRYLVRLSVPRDAWSAATVAHPDGLIGWDAEPVGKVSLNWGTAWANSRSTLLAKVPSIIIPEEVNVLINPAHPDIDSLKAVKVRKWLYDARLGRA